MVEIANMKHKKKHRALKPVKFESTIENSLTASMLNEPTEEISDETGLLVDSLIVEMVDNVLSDDKIKSKKKKTKKQPVKEPVKSKKGEKSGKGKKSKKGNKNKKDK